MKLHTTVERGLCSTSTVADQSDCSICWNKKVRNQYTNKSHSMAAAGTTWQKNTLFSVSAAAVCSVGV